MDVEEELSCLRHDLSCKIDAMNLNLSVDNTNNVRSVKRECDNKLNKQNMINFHCFYYYNSLSHHEIILRKNDEDIKNPKLVAEIVNKYFIRPGDLNLPSQFQQPPDYVTDCKTRDTYTKLSQFSTVKICHLPRQINTSSPKCQPVLTIFQIK